MMAIAKRSLLWLAASQGKQRYIAACLMGVSVTLAFPPLYVLPLLFVGLSGLLLVLSGCATKKQAFFTGWWFGLGHFVSGIYWMAYALLTDAAQFGWMVPFAVFGVSAVLALYCGMVTLGTYLTPVKSPISKVIVFSALWLVSEVARTYLLSGFPWNLIGYVWTFSDSMIQLASVVGIYGMGLVTTLAAASFAPFMADKVGIKRVQWKNITFPVILFCVLVLSWGWGCYRLAHASHDYVEGINLRVVQGNIKQSLKWEPGQRELNFQKYVDLTRSKGFKHISHVIWPETALPYVIRKDNPELMQVLKYVTPPKGVLLTGAMRMEETENDYNVWNSFFVITQKEGIYSHYDKFHLVPFGEYIPFRAWLPSFINKITQGPKDFSTGTGPTPLTLPDGTSVLPLICYEAIFPQYVNGEVKGEYSWVLNVTNDAWFGVSTGPYQHLNMVRMRAVEQGVPLVRAANTGVSAVFDPYGRMVSHIPLNKTGILDSKLPKKLNNDTIYSMCGNILVLLLMVFCGLLILLIEKVIK